MQTGSHPARGSWLPLRAKQTFPQAATFFHPDFTVGSGVSPDLHRHTCARGLYRRSGMKAWILTKSKAMLGTLPRRFVLELLEL
jgi:hypothetical protein